VDLWVVRRNKMPGMMYVPRQQNQFLEMLYRLTPALVTQKIAFQQGKELLDEKQQFQEKQAENQRMNRLQEMGAQELTPEDIKHGVKPWATAGGKQFAAPQLGSMEFDGSKVITYGGKPFDVVNPPKPSNASTVKVMGKDGKPHLIEAKNVDGSIILGQDLGIAPDTRAQTNVNVNMDMTKKTQSDLQEELIQGYTIKDELARIVGTKDPKTGDYSGGLYQPEFLEFAGKGRSYIENKASKLGMNVSGFTKKYNKFKAEVDTRTLKWRKFITGVAGGEKEMEKIEKTTINTDYDSPAQFKSKAEQMEVMTDAAIARAEWLLKNWGKDYTKAPERLKRIAAEMYPLNQTKQSSEMDSAAEALIKQYAR
jgi:hypothetical protein